MAYHPVLSQARQGAQQLPEGICQTRTRSCLTRRPARAGTWHDLAAQAAMMSGTGLACLDSTLAPAQRHPPHFPCQALPHHRPCASQRPVQGLARQQSRRRSKPARRGVQLPSSLTALASNCRQLRKQRAAELAAVRQTATRQTCNLCRDASSALCCPSRIQPSRLTRRGLA